MPLNVYLTFEDNCREVFDFYRSVFGGEYLIIQTFGDGPSRYGDTGLGTGPDHARDYLYRGQLSHGQRHGF